MIELVTLRRGAARAQPQGGVRHRATAAGGRAARRGRADPARRLQPQGRQDRRRLAAADPRFPQRRRRSSISSTAPRSRATARPAWSRPTTPSAPRTGRCSCPPPADGKLDDFSARRARRRRDVHRELPGLFRAQQRARRRHQEACSIRCPRVALVPGLGLFGLGRSQEGCARRRRSRRSRDRDHHRRRSDRPLRVDLRSRHVRHGILVARTGQARRRRRNAARRPGRRRSPAPAGAIGAATAKAFAAAGAEVALLDVDERGARAQGQSDRRRGARASAAT